MRLVESERRSSGRPGGVPVVYAVNRALTNQLKPREFGVDRARGYSIGRAVARGIRGHGRLHNSAFIIAFPTAQGALRGAACMARSDGADLSFSA